MIKNLENETKFSVAFRINILKTIIDYVMYIEVIVLLVYSTRDATAPFNSICSRGSGQWKLF